MTELELLANASNSLMSARNDLSEAARRIKNPDLVEALENLKGEILGHMKAISVNENALKRDLLQEKSSPPQTDLEPV
jgi:hypothetical protein